MENITLPKFKDYKVGTDPTIIGFFQGQLDAEYFNADGGYSSFYGTDIDDVKKEFQKQLESISTDVGSLDRLMSLESVFEFLEKKEGKRSPVKGVDKIQPNTLYPTKSEDGKSYIGLGWVDEEDGEIKIAPLPTSLLALEEWGEDLGFIKDIKDGGVFVWGESEFETNPDYILKGMQDEVF